MDRQAPYTPPPEPAVPSGPEIEHVPPAGFVEYWDWSRIRDDAGGVATGRLAPWLRAAAASRDPMNILRSAVAKRLETPSTDRTVAESNALADLAVTGRNSFRRFLERPPTDATLLADVTSRTPGVDTARAREAVRATLDRTYAVLWALRGAPAHRAALRPGLGWIAVSSEDDPPHTPTNVANTEDHVGEFQIAVDGVSQIVNCRASVKVARTPAGDPMPDLSTRPVPTARIFNEIITTRAAEDYDSAILFVHGLGSRLEESDHFKSLVIRNGAARGHRFAVVSIDLPGMGYSTRLDVDALVREKTRGGFHGFRLSDGRGSNFPLLSYYRDVLVRMSGHVSGGFDHVMGGSLGGNMTLWLAAEPMFTSPGVFARLSGVRSLASWSPGSIWESYERARDTPFEGNGTHMDIGKNGAKRRSQERMNQGEDAATRRSFFEPMQRGEELLGARTLGAWGYPPTRGGLIQQAEFYSAEYRRTFWMCAYEQVVFSHQEPIGAGGRSPFSTVRTPLLLASGSDDVGSMGVMDIYNQVIRVTDSAPDVPGKRLLMRGTGHSISDARPAHLADEVARFFAGTARQRAGSDGVVSWEPGRLDMFRTGTDGRAYHKFFAGGWGPGGITADWEPVGGPGGGVNFAGPVAAVTWEPGRLDAFGVGTDGRAYHKFFGGGWGPGGMTADWEPVGGLARGVRLRDRLSVVAWEPGRLDVFGVGTDGRAYHKFFGGGWGPGGVTADWEPIGGPASGVGFAGSVTAVSWEAGRLDVFGTGTDGRVHHKFFGGGWGPGGITADWEPIGGPGRGVAARERLSVVAWEPGRLDVVGTGADGRAYHKFFGGAWGPGGVTADWEALGGPPGRAFTGAVDVTSWGPGRLDMVGTGTDGRVYHKFFGGGWGPGGMTADWEPVGGPRGVATRERLGLVAWEPGRLDILGTGADGRAYHKFFGGAWGPGGMTADWELVGGAASGLR